MSDTYPSHLWHPDVTVATVVVREGYLLQVEEYAGGQTLMINQPAGHLEPDESLQEAAIRETREETGWDVRLTSCLGIYQWQNAQGQHFLRVAFVAEPLKHYPEQALDDGIERAIWMKPDELQQAHARHRSPLVWQTVADYLSGQYFPLSIAKQLA